MDLPPKLLLFKSLVEYIREVQPYWTDQNIMQIAQQIIITNQINNLNNNDLQNPEQFEIRKNQIITFFNSNYITAE